MDAETRERRPAEADARARRRRYETLRSLYGVTSLDRERLAELRELAKEFDPALRARLSAAEAPA